MGKVLGIAIVIVVLALALGGGIWLNQLTGDQMAPVGTAPATNNEVPVTGDDGALQPVQATLEEMLPDQPVVGAPAENAGDSEDTVATPDRPVGEIAELAAVGEFTGFGIATRVFDGAVFVHDVQAQLPDPAPGTFYEGWLVKKQPTLIFFSTGKLEPGANGYELVFTAQQDFPGYTDVVITQETAADGLDGNPEEHVLEGVFQSLEFPG